MEIRWIWKYTLVVIYVANLAEAKRPRSMKEWNTPRREDELNKGIDLHGVLQRRFITDTTITDTRRNAVASPFSALLLLAALAKGAVGNSLHELEAGLGLEKDEIDDYFKQVFHDLSKMKNTSLCFANKIYLQQGVRLLQEYRHAMKLIFGTTSQQVDFNRRRETVNLINSWVSKNTNGKISRMLTVRDVDPSDVVLLINTLDFVAHWQHPFRETEGLFKTPTGVKTVRMLERESKYKYAESRNLDAEIISVPYVGKDVQFHIVLPRERSSIARLLDAVKSNVDALDDALKSTRLRFITLMMPTFQTEATYDLSEIYKEMGVQQIFQQGNSGLSGMVARMKHWPHHPHVSKAIQKAFINVTAKGTEAGAASSTSSLFSIQMVSKKVRVDRPFLYLIVAAKQQLFSGIVVDPTTK